MTACALGISWMLNQIYPSIMYMSFGDVSFGFVKHGISFRDLKHNASFGEVKRASTRDVKYNIIWESEI